MACVIFFDFCCWLLELESGIEINPSDRAKCVFKLKLLVADSWLIVRVKDGQPKFGRNLVGW